MKQPEKGEVMKIVKKGVDSREKLYGKCRLCGCEVLTTVSDTFHFYLGDKPPGYNKDNDWDSYRSRLKSMATFIVTHFGDPVRQDDLFVLYASTVLKEKLQIEDVKLFLKLKEILKIKDDGLKFENSGLHLDDVLYIMFEKEPRGKEYAITKCPMKSCGGVIYFSVNVPSEYENIPVED